jgi:3-dehydroquinate dehydratase-2
MIVLVLHGPNLSSLGKRELDIYGNTTLQELNELLHKRAFELGVALKVFQTNYEGRLIDLLETNNETSDAVIINPGGLAHTSIALMDAMHAYEKPVVEVHLTDLSQREEFRQISYTSMAAEKTIVGKGVMSYIEALEYLYENYR